MEEETNKFYIEQNGISYTVNILTAFNIFNDQYCIYTIPDETKKTNKVYCAKVVENHLVKIESEDEKRLTDKIVRQLIESLKKVNY